VKKTSMMAVGLALLTGPALAQNPPIPVESAPLGPQGQHALENTRSGTVTEWQNPDGANATIVPQPAFQTAGGQICREFQQTVTIAGRPQQAYGTACRQPDGSWKLQRPESVPQPTVSPTAAPTPAPTVVYPAPPQVVYAYPPAYFPPGYYYTRPYYTSIYIGGGYGHHRHWR
jgi:hypothetical protein